MNFYKIKDEIRILGLDDGPFNRGDESSLVVGCVFRGGSWLDGVLSTRVSVDGLDSTDKLIDLIQGCRFRDLRIVMIDGLGFAGFNLVDLGRLFSETGLPVIAVTRVKPDFPKIRRALKNLSEPDFRWGLVESAGKPYSVETRSAKKIYVQSAGMEEDQVREVVRLSATRSLLPEPIRCAHLIARGIVLGESRGKA
ncbi:MAG: DUF99 family protein [Candidatus Altiarchaeales archaeon]|nr:DUF99 family protein [Candidatus Altiarchaeales archaeon]